MSIMLKRAGYRVSTCSNGHELLQLLQEEAADLLLLDIKMPGISGLDLLKILKERYVSLPVVMVTAFGDLETGITAMRNGASDYLTKPVNQQKLLSTVAEVLRRKQTPAIAETEEQLAEALIALRDVRMATLEAFTETIALKDNYTKEHSLRIRIIAEEMGKAMRLSQETTDILAIGGLLHDIGKIGIPEEILNKPSALTDAEYEIMKGHPRAGVRIASHLEMLKPFLPIIQSHHERLDGQGYPEGLIGAQIPFEVKIVSIIDTFEAMTSKRPYRDALPVEVAVAELQKNKGTQFDADLVDFFIEHQLYTL